MLSKLRICWRLFQINWILMRYGLADILSAIPTLSWLRLLAYCNPYYYYNRKQPRGERLRRTLIHLGPIFVKFGQALSVRADLLPKDIIDSLSLLQDKVPPFPGQQAMAMLNKAYQGDLHSVFRTFDVTALASASIAQVHRAQLHDGRDVVVKILRPQIKKQIRRDVDVLYAIAGFLERFWHDSRRLRVYKVIAEFDKTLRQEINLQHEAANASQLRRNFFNSKQLYVPEIYWSHTRKNIMVMEYIQGVPISDVETLKARGVNLKRLAEDSVSIFFTQVIEHRFFHADMHPGNIFVCTDDPNNPYYLVVDFGIMGTLTPNDQRYLAEMFLAFFKRDYLRVAALHIESGWVAADTRLDEFEAAIRHMSEPIFEKPLKDISFAHVLWGLFETAKQFNMPVQPQLVLLQKTLVHVEGLGRQLYPDLDLWATAKPFLECWLRKQYSPKKVLCAVHRQMPRWLEHLPQLPELVVNRLTKSAGEPVIPEEKVVALPKLSVSRSVGVGLLLGAGVSYILTQTTVTAFANLSVIIAMITCGSMLTVASFFKRRSPLV